MEKAAILILAVTLVGCASAKQTKMEEYRILTQDICRDNPHEVMLAQLLYNEMKNE
jgi:lipoprotein NlpI